MSEVPRRRRTGPTATLLVDIVREAWTSRSVALLVILVLGALAIAMATMAHTVLPYAIYPVL